MQCRHKCDQLQVSCVKTFVIIHAAVCKCFYSWNADTGFQICKQLCIPTIGQQPAIISKQMSIPTQYIFKLILNSWDVSQQQSRVKTDVYPRTSRYGNRILLLGSEPKTVTCHNKCVSPLDKIKTIVYPHPKLWFVYYAPMGNVYQ